MYLADWGLARSPFAEGLDAPLFYEGETQVEALARLRFVVRQGRRLAIVVGERGVGKSAALRRFGDECRREGRRVAVVNLAAATVRETLWQLAAQFALGPQPADDSVALFRRLAAFVDALRWQRDAAIALLDDVHQAGPDVRSQLARLMHLGADQSRLSLVLTASPSRLERLGGELLDAADMRVDLEPWGEAECVGYVQHAILEAGCDRPAFDDEALSVLAALSNGVPRQLNRLADHALLAAAAEGLDTVNAATVEAAHAALHWIAAA
jgi:type II secretory pathway predicted ATPase ExeA